MTLTYSSYLEIDRLLELQTPRSQECAHDEMLFIIIHQVYELWFKEILHEIDLLVPSLENGKLVQAQFALKRILAIFRVLLNQADVLETMTPEQFCSFRESLGTASGFQSVQFRELEFVLGAKRREVLESFPDDSLSRRRLEERFRAATIWDSFLHYLSEKGWPVPLDLLRRDLTRPFSPSEPVKKILMDVYAHDPALAYFCEMLLDFDEKLQEWRYRHAKMVERIIGIKKGTGGSTGVEYLKSTLFKPSFPDLWAIRSEFEKS
jgi:tryptophan 2,3-dioxygenase